VTPRLEDRPSLTKLHESDLVRSLGDFVGVPGGVWVGAAASSGSSNSDPVGVAPAAVRGSELAWPGSCNRGDVKKGPGTPRPRDFGKGIEQYQCGTQDFFLFFGRLAGWPRCACTGEIPGSETRATSTGPSRWRSPPSSRRIRSSNVGRLRQRRSPSLRDGVASGSERSDFHVARHTKDNRHQS